MGRSLVDVLLREFGALTRTWDTNQGHGYGRLGEPRGAGMTSKEGDLYPYVEPPADDHEGDVDAGVEDGDIPLGPAHVDLLNKIGVSWADRDNFARKRARVDRGSFAHSSGRGLGESIGVGSSISPIPGLYRSKDGAGAAGGVAWSVYKTGPGLKGGGHGSKAGYFGPPPPSIDDPVLNVYDIEELPDSDELTQIRLDREVDEVQQEYRVWIESNLSPEP